MHAGMQAVPLWYGESERAYRPGAVGLLRAVGVWKYKGMPTGLNDIGMSCSIKEIANEYFSFFD